MQRTRTLHDVADRMSVAVTPADVAEVLSSSLQGLLAADLVEVYKLDDGRRRAELLASTGNEPEPLVARDELAFTLPGDDRPPDEAASRRYTYPLAAGLRTSGAVRLTFDTPILIDDESASMIQAITRQGGQALDRSLLYEDELVARTRTERLQALTAAFSGALTLDDVAAVFVDDALAGLSAEGIFLGVASDDRELRALAWRSYPDDAVRHLLAVSSTHQTPVSMAAREGAASYFETATQLAARHPELTAALEAIGHETFAFLPVRAGATPIGVAALSWRGRAELDDDAWSFLQALTTQCGLALDRAQRYESERSVAETLQRSVLPRSLPVMEGVRVAARYLPGMSALDVGGDWFDTLMLPDGRVGFAVGDVVGKGVGAAATMGQLRNGMRALTLDESDPGRTMTNLNRLLDGIMDAPFATVAYLTLDPKTLAATLVSAGHLPPLVIEPSGEARFVEVGRNLPLGVDVDLPMEGASRPAAAGRAGGALHGRAGRADGLLDRRRARSPRGGRGACRQGSRAVRRRDRRGASRRRALARRRCSARARARPCARAAAGADARGGEHVPSHDSHAGRRHGSRRGTCPPATHGTSCSPRGRRPRTRSSTAVATAAP